MEVKKQNTIIMYPHMRSISDDNLLRLYKTIKPIATFTDMKYTLKDFSLEQLRSKEFEWYSENNKKEVINQSIIETIGDFLCLHTNELASLDDILSQIPDYIIGEANAFEIVETPEIRRQILGHNKNMCLSKIRTYKINK